MIVPRRSVPRILSLYPDATEKPHPPQEEGQKDRCKDPETGPYDIWKKNRQDGSSGRDAMPFPYSNNCQDTGIKVVNRAPYKRDDGKEVCATRITNHTKGRLKPALVSSDDKKADVCYRTPDQE